MDKKIYFDHAFTGDQEHKFWKQLQSYGFTVSPVKASHPNALCRFIHFEKSGYLEFVHNPDFKKIDKCPGISFGTNSKLKSLYLKLTKKGLKCIYFHRNYNWKDNEIDYLPGWNFLDFKKLGFKTFFPWITEYESSSANQIRKEKLSKHRNGVSHVIGHEFIVNDYGIKFFSQLFGTKITDKLELPCGRILYFKQGRTNYHSKIILGSKNINRTMTFIPEGLETSFLGRQSVLIRNPNPNKRMWDILITSLA